MWNAVKRKKIINEISRDKRSRFDRRGDIRAYTRVRVNADLSLSLSLSLPLATCRALLRAKVDTNRPLCAPRIARLRILMLAYAPTAAIRSLSGA